MTSAWQNLNPPVELARMRSERAPEPDTWEPVRLTNPQVVLAEPTYDRGAPALRQHPPARPIRQSGFAPARQGRLDDEAGASDTATKPQVPVDGMVLGTAFAEHGQAPKQSLRVQPAHRAWEPDCEPVQRKLPIWAPPHVRAHTCQLPAAGTDTGPGKLLVVSNLPPINGLQCAVERHAVHSEIEPVIRATLSERREGIVSPDPWQVSRPTPAMRIVSPRLGIPLPTLEQRG